MIKHISWRSFRLSYRTEGSGFPVVLLHGFAEDGTLWAQQVAFLKNQFRLIIPDLPGSSPADRPTPTGSMNGLGIDDHADALRAIADAEGLQDFVLIGHSMGGYVALAFADKFPGTLRALGLFHSTAYADSEEKRSARRKSIAFIRKHGASEFILQSVPDLFSAETKVKRPEMIRELIDRYDNFNPDSLVSYYEAMMVRPDRTLLLRQFNGPVLFMIGEEDKAVPLEHSLQQSHIPELSYIHILKNTAHMGMLEAADEANALLLSFIINVAV